MPPMAEFTVVRETHIDADPARVHALINDFHHWTAWSPWEGLDPAMDREYSGAGPGRRRPLRLARQPQGRSGQMQIVGSNPQQIDVKLVFLKPWQATNDVVFATDAQQRRDRRGLDDDRRALRPLRAGRPQVVSMDRLVGKDFEKGLARLKTAAES